MPPLQQHNFYSNYSSLFISVFVNFCTTCLILLVGPRAGGPRAGGSRTSGPKDYLYWALGLLAPSTVRPQGLLGRAQGDRRTDVRTYGKTDRHLEITPCVVSYIPSSPLDRKTGIGGHHLVDFERLQLRNEFQIVQKYSFRHTFSFSFNRVSINFGKKIMVLLTPIMALR